MSDSEFSLTPLEKSTQSSTNTSASNFLKSLPQIWAVMVKNVLLLTYGMTAGFPTILIPHLSEHNPEEEIYLEQEEISWIGSLGTMCVPLGCLLSGVLVTQVGRRKSMQVVCAPFLLCSIGFKYSVAVWQIYLALAINGVASGLLEAPVLTYVAEISEPRLRGILSATGSLAVQIGIVIEFVLGTFLTWRDVAFATSIAPLISYCLLFLIPESPQWLITKKRYDDARKSLAWLRGWTTIDNVEIEFQEMLRKQTLNEIDTTDHTYLHKYTRRNFVRPLSLLCFIFFLSSFTGTTPIQTFSVKIFAVLQTPMNKYHATILLGGAALFGTLPCIIFIRYVGKRVLVFTSLIIGSISVIVVASFAYISDIKDFDTDAIPNSNLNLDMYKFVPLAFLIIAAFAFQGGIRMVPWILTGEMFSRATSPIGSGIAGAAAYTFGFLSNKVFLHTVSHLTLPGTFWLYGSLGLLGVIILYFLLPETEGKTLQEITDHFSGDSKLENKVRRTRDNEHKDP